MKIQKIKIEGFGLFNKPVEFHFDDKRINIIYGNNETGKTTLMRGIIATLFGIDKSRWALLKPFRISEKYYAEIQFIDKGFEYKLFRDFESNKVHFRRKKKDGKIENLFMGTASPQARTEEKEFYYDELKKVIGLNNETLFKNVNVIYQKSIETMIDKEIQHILTGAVGTNYKTVLEQWMKQYFNITRKSAWKEIQDRRSDRKIDDLEKELHELTGRKENIISSNMKTSKLDEKIKKLEDELKILEEEMKKNKKEYELSKQYIDLLKEKDNNEEKVFNYDREIEKYSKLKKELDSKKELIEQNYPDLKDVTDDDINLIKESNILKKELQEKSKDLDTLKRQKDTTPVKKIILGINGIVISILIFIAKLMYHKPFLLYISIGMVVAALVYLIISIINRYKASFQYKTQLFSKSSSISELQSRLSALNEKIQHLSAVTLKESLSEQYKEYRQINQELDNLTYALNQLSDQEEYSSKREKIEKSLISINADMKKLEDENPGLVTIKENREKTTRHIQSLKEETDKKESRGEEVKKQIYDLNKELIFTAVETESTASINYKIEELTEEFNKYNDSKEAYELAINTLNEAITEYQGEHIGRLSKNISQYYKKITKDMHGKVELTEDFQPVVQDEDNKALKNISCGAEDQLYFAVRLALVKEINDLTPLPLLLDDPFVNFDRERMEVVKDILHSISEENQVILFTHIKHFTKWDNINVIKMR